MSVADKARKILQDVTGMWWPDADEGGLRDAAKAWRDFADDVEDVTAAANKAARSLIENNKGEAISAFDDPFWRRYYYDKHGWLKDLSDAARDMAKALDAYADAVHHAKKKLEHELEIVGGTILVGTGLAFFTGGLSEGPALAAATTVTERAPWASRSPPRSRPSRAPPWPLPPSRASSPSPSISPSPSRSQSRRASRAAASTSTRHARPACTAPSRAASSAEQAPPSGPLRTRAAGRNCWAASAYPA
ncbi:WXG100-like domain-containing protein [Streptomyces mirabilis]|uniref:WXG100-like domain-containing protein n=1 Tax=Streptomyces mirabilis TaxID=68239 RepID=UPI003252A0DD